MIFNIDSRQNDKIKEVVKLSNTKYAKEKRLFKIEGFHALEMALKNNAVKCIYTTKEIKGIDKTIPQFLHFAIMIISIIQKLLYLLPLP